MAYRPNYSRFLVRIPARFGIYERVGVEKRRFSYRIFGKCLNQSQNRRTATMLYLGIDQHARQITVSLRDKNGDTLLARQVSTQPAKINAFFQQLTRQRLQDGEQFVAV